MEKRKDSISSESDISFNSSNSIFDFVENDSGYCASQYSIQSIPDLLELDRYVLSPIPIEFPGRQSNVSKSNLPERNSTGSLLQYSGTHTDGGNGKLGKKHGKFCRFRSRISRKLQKYKKRVSVSLNRYNVLNR